MSTLFALPLLNNQIQYVIDGKLIPFQFPYLTVLLLGRPQHDLDDFSHRYPQMERGKRAKLFAPFDALDGYSENVNSKKIHYGNKVILSDAEQEELNRRLTILHQLTRNSRLAKACQAKVTVRYFVLCTDEHSFACKVLGQYVTVTGIVRKVDVIGRRILLTNGAAILWDDLCAIESEEGLFDMPELE